MNIVEALDLKLPIFQAPLESYPNQSALVAKVSESGALGVYSANYQSLVEIEAALADIQLRTDASFAVLIDVREDEQSLDLADKSSVNAYLGTAYQILDIDRVEAEPLPTFSAVFETVMAKTPAAVIFQNGLPDNRLIQDCRRMGVFTMAIASNLLEVAAINNSSVDAIVLQGLESAGVQSQFNNDLVVRSYPVNTLLSQTLKYAAKPVVVWGDYQESPHIVAALVNGASGVMIDTAFWVTQESPIPEGYREALEACNEMTVTQSSVWSGYLAQCINNVLTQEVSAVEQAALSPKKQQRIMQPIIRAAIAQNNADYLPLWAGLCVSTHRKTVSELCEKYYVELNSIIE